jgi:tRNA-guanine family transglycosylase
MFRIHDIEGLARTGNFKVDKTKFETPIIWFGTPPTGVPRVWKFFNVSGIMTNAYFILKYGLEKFEKDKKNIHDFLGTKSPITIDSGGFLFLTKTHNMKFLSPEKVLEVYQSLKPNIGVTLDYPLNPKESKIKRRKKQMITLYNTKKIIELHKARNPIILPVIHGFDKNEVNWFINKLNNINDFEFYGVGSFVPFSKGIGGSIYNVVDIIIEIKKRLPDKPLHVFGIGGTTTMHLMFLAGADSIDSMSWRLKAGYGAIQLPGIGDRFIRPRKDRTTLSKEERKLLEKCDCPVCKEHDIYELDDSFQLRAIHNAWVFQKEVEMAKEMIEEQKYIKFVEERTKKTRFANVFQYIKRKISNK